MDKSFVIQSLEKESMRSFLVSFTTTEASLMATATQFFLAQADDLLKLMALGFRMYAFPPVWAG